MSIQSKSSDKSSDKSLDKKLDKLQNTQNKFSIFIEHKEDPNLLTKENVMKLIPPNAFHLSQSNLAETLTEWRWRFFEFPDRENKTIEMSFKKPSGPRLYVTSDGKWVEREIDQSLNEFVTEQYYSYSN